MRDPLSPEPPRSARYEPGRRAWILSRYDDVVAAMREPALAPDVMKATLRDETRTALTPAHLDSWRDGMERAAVEFAGSLPRDGAVDLAGDFLRPWSRRAAGIVTGAADADGRLAELARDVSSAAADPGGEELKRRAETARAAMEGRFPNRGVEGEAAYVALSQTLPALLACAWLALVRHPDELARLANTAVPMTAALDELLRYAGLPRALFRTASAAVEIGGAAIGAGGDVVLEIASANRDPQQFADPDRLDLRRPAAAQLSLGAAPRQCPGGPLIRMAMGVATAAFAREFPRARLAAEVDWIGGEGFQYPSALWVARIQ